MGLMVVLLVGAVCGASTFVTPLDNEIRGGEIVFNVTTTFPQNGTTNCSVTGSSSSTNGALAATLLFNHSDGPDGNTANETIDTGTLKDASDWTFSGTCYNQTHSETLTAITGITIDNTAPVCSQSTLASSTEYDPELTKTVAITVKNSTSCWAIWDSNYYSGSEDTSEVCTFTIQGIIADQLYKKVNFYSKDGYNQSDCSNLTDVTIKSVKPKGWITEEEEKQREALGITTPTDSGKKDNTMLIVILVVIGLGLVLSQKDK